jgi:hypothetical protein
MTMYQTVNRLLKHVQKSLDYVSDFNRLLKHVQKSLDFCTCFSNRLKRRGNIVFSNRFKRRGNIVLYLSNNQATSLNLLKGRSVNP